MKRRRTALIALAAVALVLLATLLLRKRAPTPAPASAQAPASASRPVGTRQRAEGAEEVGFDPKTGQPTTSKLRRVIEDYKRKTQYPPTSRPHDAGTAYKLKWNESAVIDLPMDDRKGQETLYRFGADRGHVVHGASLTTWLEVWPAADPARRLPFEIISAWVMIDGGRGVELAYHDDGKDGDAKAGDHVFSNRLRPIDHEQLSKAKRVQIVATIKTGDLQRQAVRDFTYAPRPVLDLIGVSDAVVDGSLQVTLDVDVHEAGAHTIETNLMGGPGFEEPIGWTRQFATLDVGRHQIKVVYFGKILHDLALAGPYQVRDFRGFLRFADDQQQNIWWSDDRVHTTPAHELADFSAAEWDAPEKREHLQLLEAELAKSGGK